MLNAVRRGPGSIARNLLSPFNSRTCLKSIVLTKCPPILHVQSGVPFRTLGTSLLSRQRAAYQEREEEKEDEIENEIFSQEPPSDAQITEATRLGPITKFKELSRDGLVCNTVVDTITEKMGLEIMTQVQSLTINETLKGIDV